MSLFSYIFFPRPVNSFNFVNNYTCNRLTYNDLEKVGLIPWFALWYGAPIKKEEYLSLTLQDIEKRGKFPFAKNACSYELFADFIEPIDKRLIDSDLEVIKSTDTVVATNLSRIISDNLSRHQLYHLINNNIKSGECVEIYSQWLDWDAPDIWGPPKHTYELSLKEVFDNRKFYISTEENDLYIIHKP